MAEEIKLNRRLRRLMAKASRDKKHTGQIHKSAKDIINEDGLGHWMQFVELTEQQKMDMTTFLMVHMDMCICGDADETSWNTVFSGILEGYVFSKHFFDRQGDDTLQRTFKSCARLYDSARLAFETRKQTLTSNLETIRDTFETVVAMRDQLNRKECDDVMKYIGKNYETLCHEVFDGGSPKSFAIPEGRYL